VGFNGYPHIIYTPIDFLDADYRSSTIGLILDTNLDVQSPLLLSGIE